MVLMLWAGGSGKYQFAVKFAVKCNGPISKRPATTNNSVLDCTYWIYTVAAVPTERKPWLIGPISAAAEGPLYQQIVDRLKREVSEGRLKPGAPLPSFRVLAEELLVSVITVKRAYEELEREGIIYRRQGLGTFVSEQGHDRSREAKLEAAKELIREGFREAAEAGLGPGELAELARELLRRKK